MLYGTPFRRLTDDNSYNRIKSEDIMKTAEDIINDKQSPLISIGQDAPIIKAVHVMVARRVGAMLVTRPEDDDIVGIWTERDLLRNILEPGFDPGSARIGDYMACPVFSASHDTSLEKLQDMFLGLYIRHILILKGPNDIGLISLGDVMRAGLLEKDKKIKELNSIAGWEYYENWGWERKYEAP